MQNYQLAIPAELEAAELRELERRTDLRVAEQRAQRAEHAAAKLRAECAKAQKERQELAAFVTVIALVVVMAVCVTAAPIWTAAFPMAGALAVMRKVGWR